jgi:Nbl1 / Borealin N terminal
MNLAFIVAHRTRQFEAWLKDRLENFTIHQEGQVSRIPKQVRAMTMREFGQKYEGNIQSALRGYQKDRLVAAGGDATLGEIDKSLRKRKWIESQEAEAELSQPKDADSQRALKNGSLYFLFPIPSTLLTNY